MATTLDRDRDNASGETDAPTGSGEKCTMTEEGVQPATTPIRSPDGKSERGDDGGKGVRSSGNGEEMEDGSTVCKGDDRSGMETRHRIWRRDTRCCTQEETNGIMVLVSS